MAQLERNSEGFKNTKTPHSIQFDQLIQGEERCWSPNTSPTQKSNNDQEEASPNHQHNKKSVLTKVKERAKKLRHSLSGGKKKHENQVPGETSTPAWGAALEENEDENEDEDEYDGDDDDDDDQGVEDEDPEYLGAPMYESELAPEDYRETARQHPRADPLFSEKSLLPLQAAPKQGNEKDTGEGIRSSVVDCSNATETQPSSSIDSKFSGLSVATGAETTEEKDKGISSPTRWDKGVSVREYLMNKLEPGEDEKELSRVISEAMSPRNRAPGGDRGVVEKVKDAVSSFLRPQQPPINQFLSRVAAATNHPEASPSQGSLSVSNGNLSPLIPVSTNAHEAVEEQSEGRILQTN